MNELKEISDKILAFRDSRNWKQFHNGKDLAVCLSVEASELLELFLWKDAEDVDGNKLKDELADVFYSGFLLADCYDLDIKKIILDKLEKNKEKYPVEKSKNSSKKYTEL